MPEKLMILGTQMEMCELVRRAKSRGYETFVCDGYDDGPARAFADHNYCIDVRKIDEIAGICREEKIDHIITSFSDIMFECMTRIADRAGLPHYIPASMLDVYRDKAVTKRVCRELGIAVPRFVRLEPDFSDSELEGMRFPCILKPEDSYGSRGLRVVHSVSEVREHFAASACYSTLGTALLEEISRGQELNCMAFVVDGKVHMISIADRITGPLRADMIPILYEVAYPSRHYEEAYPAVLDLLQRFADYTGQKWGPISTQCFWDGRKAEVCEIAGRMFGFEHELVTMTTGLDVEDLLLDLVCDQEAVRETFRSYDAKGSRCAAGLYIHSVREGTVADQHVLRELARDPDVTESVLFYEDGEKAGVLGPKQYFVRFYVQTKTREELERKTNEILRKSSALDEEGRELLYKPPLLVI